MERTPPDDELFEDDSFEWEDTAIVDARGERVDRPLPADPDDSPRTFRGDLGRLGDRLQAMPPTQRWITVGGAAVLVIVIVVAVVLATRGGDDQAGVAEVSPPAEVDPGAAVLPEESPEALPPADGDGGGSGSGSATASVPTDVTVRAGDEGDAVEAVQQALNQLGYDAGKADGVFGPGTEAAVVTFQEDQGLPADGVVGPETAKAMNDALTAQLP